MTTLRSPLEQSTGFVFPETSSPKSSPSKNNQSNTHSTANHATHASSTYTINPNESSYFISHSRFPTLSQINTIEENLVGGNSTNQFEKSFTNLNLKKVNSRDTVNSDSTLIDSLHNKNDSVNSINSLDTLNSFRLKRFNSSSSVPPPSSSLSPENNQFNFSFGNHSPCTSISGISSSPSYSVNSNNSNNGFQLKKIIKFPKPEKLKIMNNTELSLIMEGMTPNDDNESILILDVRPFIEFNQRHIKNSLNFNLPSTLLKRTNFTLTRCLSNLSILENVKINKFLKNQSTTKKIIIYDDLIMNESDEEVSLATYGSSMKFFNDQQFQGEIYVLKYGFQKFQSEFNDLTEQSNLSSSSSQQQSNELKPPHNRSLSLANVSSSSLSSPISPNLSRFQLPKLPKTPVFKIRHNEEFYDFDNYKIINEFKFLNSTINEDKPKTKKSFIPSWLTNSLNKNNYLSLFQKFKNLEVEEKKRINNMIATNSVTSGIELGFKNRYKDIFPYEHSRVKLALTPTCENINDDGFCNYINANYINCPNLTKLKYIATQAPLLETTQDFTKLIKDNDVPLIISLTNQFENGVEKCYSYWNDDKNFTLLETENFNGFIIRRLLINKYQKEVLQIQILNWSDFDVLLDNQQVDILKLVYLKRSILTRMNKQYHNVIVHCSAGCGRTGTFCTLDSIINSDFNSRTTCDDITTSCCEEFDPVFQIVENFRVQRISMVQNLRQYLFIYDCLLNFYINFSNFQDSKFKNLDDLTILKNFLKQ